MQISQAVCIDSSATNRIPYLIITARAGEEDEKEEEEVEKGAPTVITSNRTDPVRPLDETPAPPFPFVSHIQPLPRISWNWIEILTLCQPSTQHWQVFFGHVEWILESEKMYNNYNYHLIIIM